MAQTVNSERAREHALIAEHVEPHPYRPGHAEWRLKEHGVPVWAIIGALTPDGDNAEQVAQDYKVSREAIEAARAYYQRYREHIDARLFANRAS